MSMGKLTRDKVMVACVTGEVTMIVQPAVENNIDRIHLIHFVKEGGSATDRSEFYRRFYEETSKQLHDAGIEVVEHSDAETYIFRRMMSEIYSILLDEVVSRGSHVYVNMSAGTSEYAAAAAISSMMFKGVDIFTVSKGYDDRTIDYDQLLSNAMKDGKLVGSCTSIGSTYMVEKFPIARPDDNLLKAFKVYSVISDCGTRNSNTVVIRNLILKDIWLAKGPMEPGSAIKGTSVEMEDPEKGYSCPRSKSETYTKRQRGEAVQYCRLYVEKWLKNGWIEAIPNTRRYRITGEGRTVMEVFCPDSFMDFGEKDIIVQTARLLD